MSIKNNLRKEDRYGASGDIIRLCDEIGETPIIYTKKRKNIDEKILKIPIEYNAPIFYENKYKLHVQVLREGEEYSFQIVGPQKMTLNNHLISNLKEKGGANNKKIIQKYKERILASERLINAISSGKDIGSIDNSRTVLGMTTNSRNTIFEDHGKKVDINLIKAKSDNAFKTTYSAIGDLDIGVTHDTRLSSINNSKIEDNLVNIKNIRKMSLKNILNHSISARDRFASNISLIAKSYEVPLDKEIKSRSSKRLYNLSTSEQSRVLSEKINLNFKYGKKFVYELRKIDPNRNYREISNQDIVNVEPEMFNNSNISTINEKQAKSKQLFSGETEGHSVLINEMYGMGIDPSTCFDGCNTHREKNSFIAKLFKNNTSQKKNDSRSSFKRNALKRNEIDLKKRFLRQSMFKSPIKSIMNGKLNNNLGSRSFLDIQTDGKLVEKAYKKSVPDISRITFLEMKFKEAQSFAGDTGIIKLRYVIKNEKGLNVFSKVHTININDVHSVHMIDMFEFPNYSLNKIKKARQTDLATLTVQNNSKEIGLSYKLFTKNINQVSRDLDLKFTNVRPGVMTSIEPGNKPLSDRIKIDANSNSMFRLTPGIPGYISFNNIMSYEMTGKKNNNNQDNQSFKIFGRPSDVKGRGLELDVSGLPRHAKNVKLLKRNSKKKGAIFKEVKVIDTETKKQSEKSARIDPKLKGAISRPVDTNSPAIKNYNKIQKNLINDPTARDDEFAEYKLKIIDKNGSTKVLKPSLKILHRQRRNVMTVNVSAQKMDLKHSSARLKVQISKSKEEEAFDKKINNVYNSLSTDEKNSLGPKLDTLRSSIGAKKSAKLYVQDMVTGEQKEIGVVFNGRSINVKRHFQPGVTRILAKPIETNNMDSFKDISKQLSDIDAILKTGKNIFSKSTAAAINNLKDECNSSLSNRKNNSDKKFSYDYMKNGKLKTDDFIQDTTGISPDEYSGMSHDDSVLDIAKDLNLDFKIKSSSFIVTPRHRIVVNVKFIVENTEDLDFLIFSYVKEAVEYPAGCAHVDSEGPSSVSFLDITNQDYYGKIDYNVRPVFENGHIGDKLPVGSVVLLRKIHSLD